MRTVAVVVATLLAAPASAEPVRIWDVPFGTPVTDLPVPDFIEPACGTNGGPPGFRLGTFDRFGECPVDAGGLREIWFIHDDTLETVARARRDPTLIGQYRATSVLGQPVILSFLVDDKGAIRGYRIFTDPKADPSSRINAYNVGVALMARFGLDWECVDRPPESGQRPIGGKFLNQTCRRDGDGFHATAERRFYYKPGQAPSERAGRESPENLFESMARIEVVQTDFEAVAPLALAASLASDAASNPADPVAAFIGGNSNDCPGCQLTDADLRYRDLTGADLSGADLTGALLHRSILKDADLRDANLTGANLNRTDLSSADFSRANLTTAMMWNARGSRANFENADLNHALMGTAQLPMSNFRGANLDVADLGGARLNDASLAGARLNGAILDSAVLIRADLSDVRAEEAIFEHANLRYANISRAYLRKSNLRGANLGETNLEGADFSGARLSAASLVGAMQDDAVFTGAIMPDNQVR